MLFSTSLKGQLMGRPITHQVRAEDAVRPVIEGLERRALLSVSPAIAYSFDDVVDSLVPNSGSRGHSTDGVLAGDIPPQVLKENPSPGGGAYLHLAGSGSNFASGGRVDVGQLDDHSTWLDPILNASSSLAFYVRTRQTGSGFAWTSPSVAGVEQTTGGNDVFWGSISVKGKIGIQAGDFEGVATPSPVNDGKWHHITLTRDALTGEEDVYLEGVLVGRASRETGVKTTPFRAIGATSRVNGLPGELLGYIYLNGDIDQLEVFDHVLNAAEVAQQYAAPVEAAPSAPGSLQVDTSFIRAIRITFPSVPGAQGYRLLRSDSGIAGTFREVGIRNSSAADGDGTLGISDVDLDPGRQYFYQLTAFNQAGEAVSNPVSGAASATGRGATGVRAYAVSDAAVDVEWTDLTGGELSFKIEQSNFTQSFFSSRQALPAGTTRETVDYFSADILTWKYRVATLDSSGQRVSVSEEVSISRLPPRPYTHLELTDSNSGLGLMDWLVSDGDSLFFRAGSASNVRSLYKTDGTASGTVRLGPAIAEGLGGPPVLFKGVLYFIGVDPEHGAELWRSDGTPAGTSLLKDISPGAASSNLIDFTVTDQYVYFLTTSDRGGTEQRLWRTDGTALGTIPLAPDAYITLPLTVYPDAARPPALVTVGSRVFFTAYMVRTDGFQLWTSDGTPNGTTVVSVGLPQLIGTELASSGDQVYFVAKGSPESERVYSMNAATLGQAVPVAGLPETSEFSLPRIGVAAGHIYLFSEHRLYATDGTAKGPAALTFFGETAVITRMAAADDGMYFVVAESSDEKARRTIWKSDGTSQGTLPLRQIDGSKPYGTDESIFLTTGRTLFFEDFDGHLWHSDGTQHGTARDSTTRFHSFDNNYTRGRFATPIGDRLYFAQNLSTLNGLAYLTLERPDGPTRAGAVVNSGTSALITWGDESSNESGFGLERFLVEGYGTPQEKLTSQLRFYTKADATSFLDPTLASGQAYRYRVFAYTAGGESTASAWTEVISTDVQAPRVEDIAVSGSSWSKSYLAHLRGLEGSAVAAGLDGYLIEDNSQPLPWTNLDRLSLRFSEDVKIAPDALKLVASSGSVLAVKDFSYDPQSHVSTWIFESALSAGLYTVTLDTGNVSDATGNPNTKYQLNVQVLPGDVDRNGAVTATDLVRVRNAVGRSIASPGLGSGSYIRFADVDGDGVIRASELVLVRNRIGTAAGVPNRLSRTLLGETLATRSRPVRKSDEDLLGKLFGFHRFVIADASP